MRSLTRAAGATALAAATLAASAAAFAGPARAAVTQHHGLPGARHAVFVQTDNTAGNRVVAYHRGADGSLSEAGSYSTHGAGGQLSGSVVDHLASQGSLSYDAARALLIAVNAGSNTVSVFSVSGDRLALRQVIGSGGTFPVSVASRGGRVYVANAENGGTVQGYRSSAAGSRGSPARTGRSDWTRRPRHSSLTRRVRWPSHRADHSSSSRPRPTATTLTCSASASTAA